MTLTVFIFIVSSLLALDTVAAQPTSTPAPCKTTTTPAPLPSCPIGYSEWNNSCYRIYHRMQNWFDALVQCLNDGGNLASIHSTDENTYILALVLAQPPDPAPVQCGPNPFLWIGFNDPLQNLNNIWSDMTDVSFTNWTPGAPAIGHCGNGAHCAIMIDVSPNLGQWSSDPCTALRAFTVCKMPTK